MSAEDGFGKSISDFFASLTKEPAEEVGGMLADRVRYWRLKQAVGLRSKTEEFLQQRGVVERRAVPLKLTVAIVDGATLEDDDDLHTMWAKLLTNAIDPAFAEETRYTYTEILRALSPSDARMLNVIHAAVEEKAKYFRRTLDLIEVDLSRICRDMGLEWKDVMLSADCLLRQRLIERLLNYSEGEHVISHDDGEITWTNPPPQVTGLSSRRIALTDLGVAFVRACK